MDRIHEKTFKEVLTSRYGSLGAFVMTNRTEERLFAVQHVCGVGRDSYPVYKYEMVRRDGLFGLLGFRHITEEVLDVAPTFAEAVKVFGTAVAAS